MKKIVAFCLAVLLVMSFSGCRKAPDVTGVWVSNNGEETVTYDFRAGTKQDKGVIAGEMYMESDTTSMQCTYEVTKKGEIYVYSYSPINGKNLMSTLTYTTENGETVLKSEDSLIFYKQ